MKNHGFEGSDKVTAFLTEPVKGEESIYFMQYGLYELPQVPFDLWHGRQEAEIKAKGRWSWLFGKTTKKGQSLKDKLSNLQ